MRKYLLNSINVLSWTALYGCVFVIVTSVTFASSGETTLCPSVSWKASSTLKLRPLTVLMPDDAVADSARADWKSYT